MELKKSYDMIVKLVLLGESSVGKTNLLLRYTKNTFKNDAKATIGMDFVSEQVKVNDTMVKT